MVARICGPRYSRDEGRRIPFKATPEGGEIMRKESKHVTTKEIIKA
jgi:hypothetical protein